MVALSERIAELEELDLPDLVTVRNNISLKRVTLQWPRVGLFQFPTQRPGPMPVAMAVPQRTYLRAECGFWLADDEIKLEAGLPTIAQYVECQVINVGFWSFAEARKNRGVQVCISDKESVMCEVMAFEMIG